MLADIEQMRIGTLRARGAPRDDIAFRQALTHMLACADLRPAGIPPSAVLIVRRVAESLSGTGAVHEPADRHWERRIRARLEDLYRHAARPGRGPIADDCEAVVFMSRAELLACLARDLVRGIAWQRWWWQVLLARWPAGLAPSQVLAALFAAEPGRLPAVIAQLHATGDSTSVLGAIETDAARTLTRALAAEFGLALVGDALSPLQRDFESGGDGAPPGHTHAQAAVRPALRDHPPSDRDPREPLADFDEPVCSGALDPLFAVVWRTPLTREHRLLLGMALALAQRPWVARTESFQRDALRYWWHATPAPRTGGPPMPRFNRQSPPAESAAGVSNAVTPDTPAVVVTDRDVPMDLAVGQMPGAGRAPLMSTAAASSDCGIADAPGAAQASALHRVAATNDAICHAPVAAAPAIARDDVSAGSAFADPVTSEFGGVLYLINLMTALELPECFEHDWRLASRFGPWALLETLGRVLLEAAAIDATADPLWSWLAALDGRPPGEPPGRELTMPPVFRLPHTWIAADVAPGDTYYMAQAGGRLRLWSEGVLLAEVPRDARAPARQAAAELGRLVPGADRTPLRRAPWRSAPLAHLRLATVGPALRQFMAFVLPFLRHRLALALGDPAAGPAAVAALLRCRARLYASSSHVDLVASLDAISLPARLAGLDRDPGWQPSLGRVVSFHFE